MVALVCPRCRRLEGDQFIVHRLDSKLACAGCGVVHPQATTELGGTIPVVVYDPTEAQNAASTTGELVDALSDEAAWSAVVERGGHAFERLVTYAGNHWGAFAKPALAVPDRDWIGNWLDEAGEVPDGPVLLLGAAAGGEVVVLPDDGREVFALDADAAMLLFADAVGRGLPWLPVQRYGGRYERRPLDVADALRERLSRVSWIAGNAMDPPFEAESFAAIVCINLVDSIFDPAVLLGQCQSLLGPGGALVLASPFAWSDAVTPVEKRIDRYFDADLDHAEQMVCLLTGAMQDDFMAQMRLQRHEVGMPWPIRVEDRMTAQYSVHAMLLRKEVGSGHG